MRPIIRPISSFPPPETAPGHRRNGTFKTTVGRTIYQLGDELRKIGARDVVIEIDVSETDIRLDGDLRADARPRTPRVIVSFTHPQAGPVRYPCDRFHRWDDNLRAITLSLEALREVDRYGVTRKAEQYAGWKAIGSGSTTATRSATWASETLASAAGALDTAPLSLRDWDSARRLILSAQKRAHPDAGGSEQKFHLVQEAAAILRAHHGQAV